MRVLLHGLVVLSVFLALGSAAFATPIPPTTSAAAGLPAVAGPLPGLIGPLPDAPPPSPYVSVKLKDPGEPGALDRLHGLFGASLLRRNPHTGVDTLRVPPHLTPRELAQQLAQDPRVEWAEDVKWRRLSDVPRAPLHPNDALYTANQKWYYDLISAPDAWGIERGKSSVVIAVLDSGVMCAHPDLAGNMWVNPGEIPGNGLDDDKDGYVDDVNGYDFVGAETGRGDPETAPDLPPDSDPCVKAGDPSAGNGLDDDDNGEVDSGVLHGTLVAGVAAAVSNNAAGVAGMCWSCKVMAVRIANPEGWVRSSDTADGVTYAAKAGARIINMSLGGPEMSDAERAAVNLAIAGGATVVAAAGNENRRPMYFPAQLSNVLAVGASAHANPKGRASFSNWGAGGQDDRLVDVVAPGVDIVSTSVFSVADQNAGRGAAGAFSYSTGGGTSFSAPLVAGLVGLMLSLKPALTNTQVRSIIRDTATPLGDDPTDSPNAGPGWAGAGLINALAALNATMQAPTSTATPTPTRTTTPITPSATPSVSPTTTPTGATPSPTPTPLAAGSAPQLLAPAPGGTLAGLGATLAWNVPAGATQYHIQVIPFKDDGPAIELIRNIESSYVVEQPTFGAGPYVMLPGITYTWRVRTTAATVGIDKNSPQWGPWSSNFTFRTRTASSATLSAVAPPSGSTVDSRTPVLQWDNSDKNVFYYEVQASKDAGFGPNAFLYNELRHGGIAPQNSYAIPANFPLEPSTTYFWRVRPRIQGDGTPVPWSTTFSFRTR